MAARGARLSVQARLLLRPGLAWSSRRGAASGDGGDHLAGDEAR